MSAPEDIVRATRTVKRLDEQASGLRSELKRLRRNLMELDGGLAQPRAAELLLANEHLVLAALHADEIADTAVSKLDELARTSQRDALTGTPNRTLMLDRINASILLARRHRGRCALMFLDVDDFKRINDTFGHHVGDEAIMLVARRLEDLVRESDTIGRHGGDEFLILLTEVNQPADVAIVASKIIASLSQPCILKGHSLTFTASLGISIWPDDGKDAVTLIQHADAAMYQSKRRGPGGFEFHSSETAATRLHAGDDTLTQRVPELEPSLLNLREVNERLVIGALAAREKEAGVNDAHQRQIKFLAMVAHELRSPLAPLGTAAELLRHAAADDALLMRLRAIIKRQVSHMARLVDDLLDGARATTGKFRLERVPVDIPAVIVHAVESSQPSTTARQQRFTLTLPPGPIEIMGDAVRLAQVFSNLLDNASKYTPVGGAIELEAATSDQWLYVKISDDGIGISPTALTSIFDLFVQEEHAVKITGNGLGIGLAVTRELVEAHGGNVTCTSAGRGKGSQFTVKLPLQAAAR